MRTSRARFTALLLSSLLTIISIPVFAAPPAPTAAQVEAAKKAEAAKKKAADAAVANLNKANQSLRQLTAIANAARGKYVQAQKELAQAT